METGYEESRLKAALHCGNTAELRALVAAMPQDEFRAHAYEALGDACTCGWVGRARVLLEAGASPNQWGLNRLLAKTAVFRKTEHMARLLLEFGADARTLDGHGSSALCKACLWGNCRLLELLLQHGAGAAPRSSAREAALMMAAEWGLGKQVHTLLRYGADHAQRDARGWTPLLAALRFGRSNAALTLLQAGADVHVKDIYGRELLHFAFCRWRRPRAKQRPRVLRQLLAHGGDATLCARHGITPLHLAAWLGLKDELAVLLEYAAVVDVTDDEGRTPLHYAARSGLANASRLRLYGSGDEDVRSPERADAAVCDLLLEYADARHERYLGNPEPKPWAALRFRAQRPFKAMQMRFHHVGVRNVCGGGSEGGAAPSLRSKEEIARLLLKRGADARTVDAYGWTPLALALADGNEPVACLLREQGGRARAWGHGVIP